jgi:hypothetical protein
MNTGRVSDRRSRGAGVGAAAYFLLTGIIFATWASRVPAIKGGLDLGDGQFAVALLGVVDVAMNTQGLALQQLLGRPVLSRLHAMHSLGGVLGAGAGALAARLGAAATLFRVCRSGGGWSRRLATALTLAVRCGGGTVGG